MNVGREAGARVLHPLALSALVVLIVNDHAFKLLWPGWLSGKLSDVAGLVLAPVVLAEAWRLLRPNTQPATAAASVTTLVVGVWFAASKVIPEVARATETGLGFIQWIPGAVIAGLSGGTVGPIGRPPIIVDPSDLLAMPALLAGWWIARGVPIRPFRTVCSAPTAPLGAWLGLAVAIFAIAATSVAPPTERIVVAQAEVVLTPDMPAARLGFDLAIRLSPDELGSATIEVRERWPFVDPAPVLRLGSPGLPDSGNDARYEFPTGACRERCELPVVVDARWGAGAPGEPTSVAFDLVTTINARSGSYLSESNAHVDADQPGPQRSAEGLAPIVLLMLGAAIAGVARRQRLQSISSRTVGIVIVAGGTLAVVLVAFGVLYGPRLDPARTPDGLPIGLALVGFGIAVGAGTVGLARGSGDALAVAIGVVGLLGLPIANRLLVQASGTFHERGLLLAALLGALGAVALAGGLAFPRRPASPGRSRQAARLFVVATQVAVCLLPFVGVLQDPGGPALLLLVYALAVWLWWEGSGVLLGLASAATVAGAWWLLQVSGPGSLIVTRVWSPWERALLVEMVVLAAVGFVAATGRVAPKDWTEAPPGGSTGSLTGLPEAPRERAP